jgi:hypothetical protein
VLSFQLNKKLGASLFDPDNNPFALLYKYSGGYSIELILFMDNILSAPEANILICFASRKQDACTILGLSYDIAILRPVTALRR